MSPEAIAELAALYAACRAARGPEANLAAIAALDEAYLRLVPERDRDLVSVGARSADLVRARISLETVEAAAYAAGVQ